MEEVRAREIKTYKDAIRARETKAYEDAIRARGTKAYEDARKEGLKRLEKAEKTVKKHPEFLEPHGDELLNQEVLEKADKILRKESVSTIRGTGRASSHNRMRVANGTSRRGNSISSLGGFLTPRGVTEGDLSEAPERITSLKMFLLVGGMVENGEINPP